MHLLMFNLVVDADDSVLGFTHRWIEELATRVDRITVVTMKQGRTQLPGNVTVHSVGKERGWSEARRALEFYRLTGGITSRDRPDVAFAHMQPLFAAMYAPIARPAGVPILLWYAHGAVPRTLRIADRLVDRSVTSTPAGYRLPSAKLHLLGQGVDTANIHPPQVEQPGRADTIVVVGRVSESKGLDVAIDALALLHRERPSTRLRIYGEPGTPADHAHLAELRARASDKGVTDHVEFAGPVRFDEVAAAHGSGSVYLNLAEQNSIDKALLEGMAAGCVPVASNEVFAEIAAREGWESLAPSHDAEAVATALNAAFSLSPAERDVLTTRAREVVVAEHSLGRLADRIAEHLEQLARDR